MQSSAVRTFAKENVFITHPVTGALWDMTPVLELIHRLGNNDPNQAAEAVYDLGNYLATEQHTEADSAARLRQMMRLVRELGAAIDSIQVVPDGGVVRQLNTLP